MLLDVKREWLGSNPVRATPILSDQVLSTKIDLCQCRQAGGVGGCVRVRELETDISKSHPNLQVKRDGSIQTRCFRLPRFR
jgi:hypothetical protein